MQSLTPTQQKTLNFITDYHSREGSSPTLREIAAHFQWKAVASAQDVVAALRKKGLLQPASQGKSRQIKPQRLLQTTLSSALGIEVPLLGMVQAGIPHEAVEHVGKKAYFPIPHSHKPQAQLFALTIEGESMIGAGFLPGDTILVESTPLAQNGDIVVAKKDSEVTVKRLAQKGSRLYKEISSKYPNSPLPPAYLVAENPLFAPIPFGTQEEDVIIGKVCSLVRHKIH
jgi:repressor LexA